MKLQSGDEVTIGYMPMHARPTDFLRQYGFIPRENDEANGSGTTCSRVDVVAKRKVDGVCADSQAPECGERKRKLLLHGAALADERKEHWRNLVSLI